MADLSIVFLRHTQNQPKDWQEKVHDICCYPKAYADGKLVALDWAWKYAESDALKGISALFFRVITCLLTPLTALGKYAGKYSKSYEAITEQYQWKIASAEARSFDRALQIFYPKAIAKIACDAQYYRNNRREEGAHPYLTAFLAQLQTRADLMDVFMASDQLELRSYAACFCSDVNVFKFLKESLEGEQRSSFMHSAILENRSLIQFMPQLSDALLLDLFRTQIQLAGEQRPRSGISFFSVKLITQAAQSRGEDFQRVVGEMLPSWRGRYSSASADELRTFLSMVTWDHVCAFARNIREDEALTEEQETAVLQTLLGGKLQRLSSDELTSFYTTFSYRLKHDNNRAVLLNLLYPESLQLAGQPWARAMIALRSFQCLTDEFIATRVTQEQFESIPEAAANVDDDICIREDIPLRIRKKFEQSAVA